jgi:SH3-like domain-containing protein
VVLEPLPSIWHSKGLVGQWSNDIMRAAAFCALTVAFSLSAMDPVLAETKPPYWASIGPSQARMRTGPGRQFPASWLYQRPDLPVKVIAVYPNWRKIEDPDGTQGWMQANLIAADRTGLVIGDVRPLRDKPSESGTIIFRAEPGVVGRLSDCKRGWCRLDVKGRMGYIAASHIWGVDPDEAKP